MSEKFRPQEDYLTLEEADVQARHEVAKMSPEQFEQLELENKAFQMFQESGAVSLVMEQALKELSAENN